MWKERLRANNYCAGINMENICNVIILILIVNNKGWDMYGNDYFNWISIIIKY